MRITLPVAAVCLAFLPTAVSAAATHPFSIEDMLAMDRITDPRPSPAGDRIVFVLRTTDLANNKGKTDLWMVGVDGSGLHRFTADAASDAAADTDPRWSTDGKSVYYLSTRSGSSQVWRLAADGAAAPQQVTDLPLDVSSLQISPDGRHLAFSLEVFPECPTLACTRERVDKAEKSKVKGHLYPDRVGFVRHWDTWSNGTRNHLFVLPIDGKGTPVDLSKGMNADTPSKPFGGAEEFAFSPDSKTVVFAARDAGGEEPWSTNFDLYQVAIDGSGERRNLTAKNPAWDTQPAFSPDGKTLAYLAMRRPGYESDRYRIMVRDLQSGQERVLAEEWDRSATSLLFAPDGKTIFATADDLGQAPVFAIDLASGKAKRLVETGTVAAPTLAGKKLVFTVDSLRAAAEIYSVNLDGSGLTQVTHVNDAKLAATRMGEVEQFQFAGWNGEPVYAHVVKPADYEAGKKYPLAFLIHGGPQVSMGNHFHYRWNPEFYAGAGFAVLLIDFHGSPGYGQAFTDSITEDEGGKPLVDLQKGLAAALARYPWIDGGNACALGASYGGFMINWIAGNWPDPWKCLVTHDGILDQRTMYYSTEEIWFPEWEHGGPYFQHPDNYERDNPVRFVDRWKVPTLVIHDGLDYRIPITEGLGVFTALQRRGIPSEFLTFPDENHWVLKPQNSIRWHNEVLSWLDQWVKAPKRAPLAGPR
ncbi:MAG TPA: S9 family peptidase [Thermoanaerobaculia bacterium]